MKMKTQCNYIATKVIKSTKDPNKEYYYAKFIDENGSELECQSTSKIDIPRFSLVEIEVDIIQGQYPKYNLISIEV